MKKIGEAKIKKFTELGHKQGGSFRHIRTRVSEKAMSMSPEQLAEGEAIMEKMLRASEPFFDEANKAATRDIFTFGRVTAETYAMLDKAMKAWLESLESEGE